MSTFLPPVVLELKSSAREFITGTREAKAELAGLGPEGMAAAKEIEAAARQEAAAAQRYAAAQAVSASSISASVDKQIVKEKELATAVGADYDAEARRAQLTASAIRRAAGEEITAQEEVARASQRSASAQEAAAARQAAAADTAKSKWRGYATTVKAAAAGAGAAVAFESLKMASDFQTMTSRLVTAAGESDRSLSMVRDGIKQTAEDTGQSLDDLSRGAYMIESAGYHGADALKALKAAAQGAKIEGADLDGVGNALTTVLNDVGAKADKASLYMSEMVTAVGQGKMRMDDLSGSIHSVLPNAVKLGLTFPQVAGALAEMTAQGMSADQSAQNLNHTIVKLAAPTAGMTKSMAAYGLTASDVAKSIGTKGLAGTLDELERAIIQHMGPAGTTLLNSLNQSKVASRNLKLEFAQLGPELKDQAKEFEAGHISLKTFNGVIKSSAGQQAVLGAQFLNTYKQAKGFNSLLTSGKPAAQTFNAAMKDMLGDQTGLQVALHLTGENMQGLTDKTNAIKAAVPDASGNVRDWSTTSQLLSTQLAQAKQMVDVLAVDIGSKLIPVVTAVTGWFVHHKTAAYALAGVIGGAMVVAIGAYVSKMVWASATTVGKIAVMVAGWLGLGPAATTAVAEAGVAEATLVAESEAAGTATAAAFGPIGLAVAAVGIVVALLATHWKAIWGKIKEVLSAAWNDVIKPVFGFIKSHWKLVVDVLTGGLGLIITHWHQIWGAVKAVWNSTIAPVFGWIKDGIHAVSRVIGQVAGQMHDVIAPIVHAFKWVWDWVERYTKWIIHAVQDVLDALSSLFSNDSGVEKGAGLPSNLTPSQLAEWLATHGGGGSSGNPGKSNGKGTGGSVKVNARGGEVGDGWFVVGDAGPEVMHKSGAGVRVYSGDMSSNGGAAHGGSGPQVLEIHNYLTLDGKVVHKSVERRQLQAGMRRGTTYQPFKK